MRKALEVCPDIYWVGALDYDIRRFDVIMDAEYGTTYNSYIVKGDDTTILFEIVKETFYDEFLERVQQVTDPSKIDYIVVNHAEPDHSGSLRNLLELCPHAVVVGTGAAIRFVKEIVNRDFKSMVVKEGDILVAGGLTLQFIMAPFLHWPDSMYTYIPQRQTLFTCDSFGCHFCGEEVFNDVLNRDFLPAYKYYFDVIMGPFKSYVLQALDKIKPLDIKIICPGHGPVLRTDIQKYIELYRDWATVTPPARKSVVVAYVSAYGYTYKMAKAIAEGIQSTGTDVYIYDLVESDHGELMGRIHEAVGLLVGSPTILGDTLPPVWQLLAELNPVIHKGKLAGAFGSYGWSGEATANIEGRMRQLRLNIPVPALKIFFNPSEQQLEEAFAFGKEFAKAVQ